MKMFQSGMNENFYFECRSCGAEMYSTNEDDHVMELCPDCLDGGIETNYTLHQYTESEYCTCEDYPCCGH